MDNIENCKIEGGYFDKKHISALHTQYHCASIDSKDGKLCFVDTITSEFRKNHKFYCLSCGEEMVANLKDDNHRRHFKHKNKTECNSETYLHNLAKKMLAEHFMKSEHFYVSYKIKDCCPQQNQCKYLSKSCTNKTHERSVDLKKFYQHCKIEKTVIGTDQKRYVADICLLSDNPKTPPMLIEIYVSHACTDEKKYSGLWIMEIPIRSEDDIKQYCETDTYVEGESTGIELFNIEKKKDAELVNNQVLRYIHIPDKGSEIRRISCKEAGVIQSKESDIELNILKSDNDFYTDNDSCLIEAIEFDFHFDSVIQNGKPLCEKCIHCNNFYRSLDIYKHWCDIDSQKICPVTLCNHFESKIYDKSYVYEILNNIDIEFVKGSKPKEYHLFVIGPHNFYNSRLIEETCKNRISELSNQNLVICGQERTGSCHFTASVLELAEVNAIPFRMFVVDWNKNGKSAGYKSNKEVVDIANELIVFNDPTDKLTQDLIQKAKVKNIPVTQVNFTQVTRDNNICPNCGGKLVRRHGRYGQFIGCFNYPDCDYIG